MNLPKGTGQKVKVAVLTQGSYGALTYAILFFCNLFLCLETLA